MSTSVLSRSDIGGGTSWIFSGAFNQNGLKLMLTFKSASGGLVLVTYFLSAPFDISTAVKQESRAFFSGAFQPSIFVSKTERRIYSTNRYTTNLVRIDLGEKWNLASVTSTDATDMANDHLSGIFANEESERLYLLYEHNPSAILEYAFVPLQTEFWTNFHSQTEIIS